VGKTVRVFRQNGNDLDIDVRGRRKFTQILSVGAGPQVCEDEDGASIADPIWRREDVGCVLEIGITSQDGSKPRTVRLWISDGDLVIEYTTKSACRATFLYTRRNGSSKRQFCMVAPPPPPPELMKNGKPDFSGTWQSRAYEGNMDAFFDDMGVGKAGRTAMSAMG